MDPAVIDPVFDNARFRAAFIFKADGEPVAWTGNHVATATFRDRPDDYERIRAASNDGSGRVLLAPGGVVSLDFPSLSALEPGTYELVVMIADETGKLGGVLVRVPVRRGGR